MAFFCIALRHWKHMRFKVMFGQCCYMGSGWYNSWIALYFLQERHATFWVLRSGTEPCAPVEAGKPKGSELAQVLLTSMDSTANVDVRI